MLGGIQQGRRRDTKQVGIERSELEPVEGVKPEVRKDKVNESEVLKDSGSNVKRATMIVGERRREERKNVCNGGVTEGLTGR